MVLIQDFLRCFLRTLKTWKAISGLKAKSVQNDDFPTTSSLRVQHTYFSFFYIWLDLSRLAGGYFLKDLYTLKFVENNSDYLQYYASRYRRALPEEPQHIIER